jgi:hypothetical protein
MRDGWERAMIETMMEPAGTLHRIEDDLRDGWVEALAHDGVDEIESYLAKHLAFLSFLDDASA